MSKCGSIQCVTSESYVIVIIVDCVLYSQTHGTPYEIVAQYLHSLLWIFSNAALN